MFEFNRRILVGIDESELGARALHAAIAMANAAGATEVHAVHVLPGVDGVRTTRGLEMLDGQVDGLRARIAREIASYGEMHGAPDIPEISAHVRVGIASDEIVRLASELQAGLIVVGTHGRRGVKRAMMGSVAEVVVRTAGCPVLVMRGIHHPAELGVGDEVEPPCPDCEARHAETDGAERWCERHAEHHRRAHVYSYEGPKTGSMRPWGF